jgi:hypothetical protein
MVAAWITQRHGLAETDGGALVRLALHVRPAGSRDRPRHAAAMNQLGVGSVRDRVHLERGHVRSDDL